MANAMTRLKPELSSDFESPPSFGLLSLELPNHSQDSSEIDAPTLAIGSFALLLHRLSGDAQGFLSVCRGGRVDRHFFDASARIDFRNWARAVTASGLATDGVAPPMYLTFDPLPPVGELAFAASAQGLSVRYRSDLYSVAQVSEWLGQWALLIAQALEDSSRDVMGYSLVTPAAAAVLPDPRAEIPFPEFPPVSEIVFAQAHTAPSAVAVEQGAGRWTYAQLEAVSSRVAMDLRRAGLLPGDRVVVTGFRSFGFFAAMLGVWRAGGVLVNIDPALPDSRQKLMVETVQASFLVLVAPLGSGLPAISNGARGVVCLTPQGEFSALAPVVESLTLPKVRPSDPAYIFSTSGSTGTPKAVQGSHAGLSHFLHWQRKEFGVGTHDRASQLTALSFDVILRDSFMVLISGGTLCIPGELDVLDPLRIVTWLRDKRITVLHVVPSLAKLWLRSLPADTGPLLLEHVFFAGEPLQDTLVAEWRARFSPEAEIVNLYGPTETTLAKCFSRVGQPTPGVQSIGGPLPQTQILILNAQRQLCGLQEPGEIAIRTPFRTLGYFQNPESNAKVFVPNPFGDDPNDLIYLTGDGGRYCYDGRVAIHGRIDNEVKIRGQRVHLGEIESLLARHTAVQDAAVLALPDSAGEKMLVAYLVPKSPQEAGSRSWLGPVRAYLKGWLPAALVPSAFVVLASLPLNPNGKVHRSALPVPGEADYFSSVADPTNAIEAQVVAVWSELLQRRSVGIDDDFFDLGGHSLLAVQLVQRIKATLGFTVTIPMLFRCRTIRNLAREMGLGRTDLTEAAVLPLQPDGCQPGLFCLVGLHLYRELADQMAPDIPVYGIFLPFEGQLLDREHEPRPMTIEELAAGYIEAIKQQQAHGPYLVCGVSFGGVLAYEVATQLQRSGDKVGFVGLLDSRLPIAMQRNWWLWAWHFLGRIFRPREAARIISKIKGRFYRVARQAHPLTGEARALKVLEARREEYYRRAEAEYRPRPTQAQVVLFRAHIRSYPVYDLRDPTYGWGDACSNIAVVDTPGDHLGILNATNAPTLAAQMRPYLLRARTA
jgi:amino acid adenylation domain-containing protein